MLFTLFVIINDKFVSFREKNYYLLTDLIARLNISRSTFSQNYPAFKTYRMKWKDFAKLLGKVGLKTPTFGSLLHSTIFVT